MIIYHWKSVIAVVIVFFLAATALIVWLMSPAAQFVWGVLPIASLVQFPWRLLGLSALTMSVVAGALVGGEIGRLEDWKIGKLGERGSGELGNWEIGGTGKRGSGGSGSGGLIPDSPSPDSLIP